MGANPFVLVFTTLYVFAYRDVIRRSAEWGAFQISVKGLVVRKLLTYSLPLLVALPLLTFIPFKNIVGRMEIHSVNLSHLVWELFISSLIVCTLGLFPRAGQYLWVIIARHKLDK